MFEKLKSFFWKKYELNEQDTKIIEIVDKLLSHPRTSVKMTAVSEKYYLINETKKYYMFLNHGNLKITNSKFTMYSYLDRYVESIILDKIQKFIEEDRQKIEDKIFESENIILGDIIKNLQ